MALIDDVTAVIDEYAICNFTEFYLLRASRSTLKLPSDTALCKLSPAEFELVKEYMYGNQQMLNDHPSIQHQKIMDACRSTVAEQPQPFKITSEMMDKIDKQVAEIKVGDSNE